MGHAPMSGWCVYRILCQVENICQFLQVVSSRSECNWALHRTNSCVSILSSSSRKNAQHQDVNVSGTFDIENWHRKASFCYKMVCLINAFIQMLNAVLYWKKSRMLFQAYVCNEHVLILNILHKPHWSVYFIYRNILLTSCGWYWAMMSV